MGLLIIEYHFDHVLAASLLFLFLKKFLYLFLPDLFKNPRRHLIRSQVSLREILRVLIG